jgi:hypothetical protein
MLKEKNFLLIKIFLISFLPVFFIWLPFFLHLKQLFFLPIKSGGMQNILKNWDGPSYLIVAKSIYDSEIVGKLLFSGLPHEYFFAHFPLYPFLIRFFSIFFSNFFYTGLFVNLLFGFLLNLLFYEFIKEKAKKPLLLTFIFTIFPARFLITRAIIAPETLMVFFILFSLVFFEKKRYFLSSLCASFAVLTKIQALFLFPAYLFFFLEKIIKEKKRFDKSFIWIFLIPATLFLLFFFYYLKTGDFLVFLKAQKQNQLYFNFPFSQFNYQGSWSGTGWLEDIVFYYLGLAILTASLFGNKQRSFFYFSFFYSLFLVFIPQRDITRFTYPLLPLFYYQFTSFFESKIIKIAFFLILPAIYFYAINFILVNQAPVADWSLLIK